MAIAAGPAAVLFMTQIMGDEEFRRKLKGGPDYSDYDIDDIKGLLTETGVSLFVSAERLDDIAQKIVDMRGVSKSAPLDDIEELFEMLNQEVQLGC